MKNYPSKERMEEEESQSSYHGSLSGADEEFAPGQVRTYKFRQFPSEKEDRYPDTIEDISHQQISSYETIQKGKPGYKYRK